MTTPAIALPVAALALAACGSLAAADPVAAVIVAPDAATRAELAAAVSRELHTAAPVLLADDALTRASSIAIDRAVLRDPSGAPAEGRLRGRPEQFRLWLVGRDCVLEHVGGQRMTLAQARCAPANPIR